MTRKRSLEIICGISFVGCLFSGLLIYKEMVTGNCNLGFVYCGSGNINLGVPACVYGFFMYLLVFIFSTLGLKSKK